METSTACNHAPMQKFVSFWGVASVLLEWLHYCSIHCINEPTIRRGTQVMSIAKISKLSAIVLASEMILIGCSHRNDSSTQGISAPGPVSAAQVYYYSVGDKVTTADCSALVVPTPSNCERKKTIDLQCFRDRFIGNTQDAINQKNSEINSIAPRLNPWNGGKFFGTPEEEAQIYAYAEIEQPALGRCDNAKTALQSADANYAKFPGQIQQLSKLKADLQTQLSQINAQLAQNPNDADTLKLKSSVEHDLANYSSQLTGIQNQQTNFPNYRQSLIANRDLTCAEADRAQIDHDNYMLQLQKKYCCGSTQREVNVLEANLANDKNNLERLTQLLASGITYRKDQLNPSVGDSLNRFPDAFNSCPAR